MISRAYWAMTAAIFMATTVMLATYTPVEPTMGPTQKIFYLHAPAAINMLLACLTVFIASIGYLWRRQWWWDDLAAAAANVAVLLAGVVLLTGMLWGRSVWGAWWVWSPRLTFSLVLMALYGAYLVTRASIASPDRRAGTAAVYGIIAFLDVPLVYLSAKLTSDVHRASLTLAGPMKLTLLLWLLAVTLISAGLIMARFRLNRHGRLARQRAQNLSRTDVTTPLAEGAAA